MESVKYSMLLLQAIPSHSPVIVAAQQEKILSSI
jgi:hypothetical protein